MPQFPFGNSLWVVTGTPGLVSQWLNYVTGGLQSALVIAMIFSCAPAPAAAARGARRGRRLSSSSR